MSRQSSSCLGRALKIAGRVLLGIGVLYFLVMINLRSLGLPIGDWPQVPLYIYTASKVTLTFDGEEIVIEGTTRCRRRIEKDEDGDLRPFVFLDHVGFTYYCGPEWFGHRLADGSALLVGAYSNSGTWRRALSALLGGLRVQRHFDGDFMSTQLSRVPPSVIWLDDAESPTRAEYYYSMAALEDPRSRLTAIDHEVEMWAASFWTSLFTGRSPSDHSEDVRALARPSNFYRMVGHHAVELSEDHWSTVGGSEELLAGLSEPTLLRPSGRVPVELLVDLSKMVARQVQALPPRFIRHGVAAVPLEVATGKAARSQARFVAPIRSVAPDTSAFRIFRFDDELPNGALVMMPRTEKGRSNPATFLIEGKSASGVYRLMWFGGLLYDPAARAIQNLRVVSF